MGYSTANILILAILVASMALRLPSETTASAVADPSPPPPSHLALAAPIYNSPIKVSLKGKAASAEENRDDESEPPLKDEKKGRKPWPKQPVSKSPPPPF